MPALLSALDAPTLGNLLRALFDRESDFRYESGDCEEFAYSLVLWAQAHGLIAKLRYGYRDYEPGYDGEVEDGDDGLEIFSHAVAEITFPDGTRDDFDYQGGDAVARWAAKWGPDFRFERRTADGQREMVSGVDFQFTWDDHRWTHCYCFPGLRPCPEASARLAGAAVGTPAA